MRFAASSSSSRFGRMALLGSVLAVSLGMTACATNNNDPYNGYNGYGNNTAYPNNPAVGQELGRVSQIEPIYGRQSSGMNVGTVLGAVVGGVLGNQVGGGSGRKAATAVGAVGGAVAGTAIQNRNAQGEEFRGYRLGLQMDNGSTRSYEVSDIGDLRIGDRIRIQGNQISRY